MAKRNKKESVSSVLYNRYFNGVQVSIMDLSKIDKAINIAVTVSAGDANVLDEKMKALVSEYRRDS